MVPVEFPFILQMAFDPDKINGMSLVERLVFYYDRTFSLLHMKQTHRQNFFAEDAFLSVG